MLKKAVISLSFVLVLFGCAQKSTEWNKDHVLQLAESIPLTGNPMDLDTSSQNVYIAEDQGGLSIVNLSAHTRQWITNFISVTGDTIPLIKIRKVSVVPEINRLFINETDGSDLIRIINTTNPDSMRILDNITGATQDIQDMKFQAITDAGSQFIYEGFFCSGRDVSYGKYGVHAAGLPPYFSITKTYTSPASANGAFFTNQYVYVAAEQRGLEIFNRSSGSRIGELDLPGEAQKVKVVGNYAYLPCRQNGLQIVNVAEPSAPYKVSGYDTGGYATNVDVWNNYAAVSSGGGGIYLFDVTNPAHPVLLDNITDCGYANNVRFLNGKLLVAARDKGLLIYKLVF
ncbi:MAG TPA: hypothetical protein PKJ14_04575 [Candidatus Cloacimonadota bacterium]|nr:hypothetical protein [Candidatus Cloacimonadota bacterium]HQL14718.1 hypothetical protein [Candidatus Cloacimonadota bacterium]